MSLHNEKQRDGRHVWFVRCDDCGIEAHHDVGQHWLRLPDTRQLCGNCASIVAREMLEALRVVEEWIRWERPIETDLGCNARDAARAAIAKAEGGAA